MGQELIFEHFRRFRSSRLVQVLVHKLREFVPRLGVRRHERVLALLWLLRVLLRWLLLEHYLFEAKWKT